MMKINTNKYKRKLINFSSTSGYDSYSTFMGEYTCLVIPNIDKNSVTLKYKFSTKKSKNKESLRNFLCELLLKSTNVKFMGNMYYILTKKSLYLSDIPEPQITLELNVVPALNSKSISQTRSIIFFFTIDELYDWSESLGSDPDGAITQLIDEGDLPVLNYFRVVDLNNIDVDYIELNIEFSKDTTKQ